MAIKKFHLVLCFAILFTMAVTMVIVSTPAVAAAPEETAVEKVVASKEWRHQAIPIERACNVDVLPGVGAGDAEGIRILPLSHTRDAGVELETGRAQRDPPGTGVGGPAREFLADTR